MTRSKLKNKANKSGKEEDLKAYKKQRNLVLKLNRKAKKSLLKSCISTNDKMENKNFWKLCKSFFTEKGSQYNQNNTLIEKKRNIRKTQFCKYFQSCSISSELKMADVIPISQKDDPFEKANYRLISLLPWLSKVYENLIYQQLNTFFENKLSTLFMWFPFKV